MDVGGGGGVIFALTYTFCLDLPLYLDLMKSEHPTPLIDTILIKNLLIYNISSDILIIEGGFLDPPPPP